MILFGALSLTNYYLLFRDPEAWPKFITSIPHASPLIAALLSVGVVLLAIYWSFVHGNFAHSLLDLVKVTSLRKEVAKAISEEGLPGLEKWISKAKATAASSK